MNEKPILFNAEMVNAILSGRKTQTRRIIANTGADNCIPLQKRTKTKDGIYTHVMDAPAYGLCPLGKVGDQLWVRETWARYNIDQTSHDMAYRATAPADWPKDGLWRPSIHMPRWASRINLLITGVRVERLQDISEQDAMSEGIDADCLAESQDHYDCIADHNMTGRPTARGYFNNLWQSIYGEENWQANPWVWCITFERMEAK